MSEKDKLFQKFAYNVGGGEPDLWRVLPNSLACEEVDID